MKLVIALVSATAMSLAPALVSAQTAPGNGQYAGQGYWHDNGPDTTGQPGLECEDVGAPPGKSANAPGSAFNEEGTGAMHYAGEQPQNSRNTASVSQYDVACRGKPR